MSTLPRFYRTVDVLTAPRDVIGVEAVQYLDWMKRGIPVPEFLVLPLTLFSSLSAKSRLPLPVAHEIMRAYHEDLKSDFVQIAQWQNIKGDANVIETITAAHHQRPSQPVIIRHQPQPSISGFALTRHSDPELRHTVVLYATWGVTDVLQDAFDTIEVDVRTWQVTRTIAGKKNTLLVRTRDGLKSEAVDRARRSAVCLPEAAARTMAQLFYSVKQQVPYHTEVRWYIKNGRLYVWNWMRQRSADEWDELKESSAQKSSERPLLGMTVIPGRVRGKPHMVTQKTQPHEIKTGEIVVCSKIWPSLAPSLKQCAGVVCEEPSTTPLILQILQKYGIPTAMGVSRALTRINTSLELELDCKRSSAALIYGRPKEG